MNDTALSGGWTDPAIEAAFAFRRILEALAHPGRIVTASGARPPPPLSQAAGIVLLTLADGTTPVHLAGAADCRDMRDWLAFHTGAPVSDPAGAAFAVGTWDALLPLHRFPVGTPDYPDRSATLIVETGRLEEEGARLTGPGINGETRLSLPDVAAFRANRALFPMGLDFFLTSENRLAGLPRSTLAELS